ncbi:MAG TPA: glycosyltransferase family 2 protein [Anaerolineaceae bacterium]|nr:glycosyltransferase family 2 protein [Anaerolineaceae bacterium]
MAQISIIIVNWNTRLLLRECLDSVRAYSDGLNCEVIVVDNASSDGSPEMLDREYPEIRLIQNETNTGFARANNQAMQVSEAEYFLLLNSDARLQPGSISSLLEAAKCHPGLGIAGARLLNPDGSFQASHTSFPTLWREFLILSGLGRAFRGGWYPSHGPEIEKGLQKVEYVEGACLFVRREAYLQVGGLDEGFFMYAEEVDWCYRMGLAGWEVWYQPLSVIIHHGSASSTGRRTQREGDLYWSRIHYFRKHYGPTAADRLKILIFWLTAAKGIYYSGVKLLQRGRSGRAVISVKDLFYKLRND